MIHGRSLTRLIAAVALLLGLVACGSNGQPGAAPAAQPTTPAAAPDSGGGHGGHGGHGGGGGDPDELELWAVQTSELGVVVTDGSGEFLYRSDKDGSAPSASNCTGPPCIDTWAPVLIDLNKPPVLLGVAEDKVSAVRRPDGAGDQLTLAGWPLYRHNAHAAGGQHGVSVNAVDGVWFVIRPNGDKAAAPA